MSVVIYLHILWPDGSTSIDQASGNTQRTALAASRALTRSYENDGCKVVTSPTREPYSDDGGY